LWLVLDRAASAPRSILETTRRAMAGGVDEVVCRLKELPEAEVLSLASEVREICAGANTPFVMSHFPRVAREIEADGVHIGQADESVDTVRELVGGDMAIGYSAHSIEEANQQLGLGADYVFLGPVFPTPAKLKYGEPLGLPTASRAAKEVNGLLVCIGGISLANLPQLVGYGISRVAAIAALQKDCDPAEAVRAFKTLLGTMGEGSTS